jgi:two-component system, response regulator PdtaR
MARSLRLVIADDDRAILDAYCKMLRSLGHTVAATARSGQELVEQCRTHLPELVMTDIKMGDSDGIEAARQICDHEAVPIIFVSGYVDEDLIQRAQAEYVLGYLVKPVRKADLETAISIAMRRFEEFQVLRMEADHYRQTLAHRKLIERAKGILMRKAHIGEAEAFDRLQGLAGEKNRKLVEIAEMIITAEEVLE